MYYKINKTALFLIIGVTINPVSAQQKFKVGENAFTISKSTALEVDSKTKGFLPPRMTKEQRDSIVINPDPDAKGLLVWCTDCKSRANLPKGEFCIYTGTTWLSFPFAAITTAVLSTGKMSDPDKPIRESAASATISGTLKKVFGSPPTETGIVYREIIDNDFATLPVLVPDATTARAVAPTYKKETNPVVVKPGDPITITSLPLVSATDHKRPYYFRTYAKSDLGISYGNTVIFNCAPPSISNPEVINGNSLNPVFTGTLTVNAGTPPKTVIEYGYCSSTAVPLPTIDNIDKTKVDKVVLSTTPAGIAALENLKNQLNSETFTTDPVIALFVNDYDVKATATTYFRYYVTANGATAYSDVLSFTPAPNPVTGGTAVAAMTSAERISSPFKVGDVISRNSITVHFKVSRAGTYSFSSVAARGATTGLSMLPVADGIFALGDDQPVTFQISGTPATSAEGNIFTVPGVGGLSTGAILLDGSRPGNIDGGKAFCDVTHTTAVVPVTSGTGQVWMDRNLGAGSAATSATDNLGGYGCWYQWGRGNDGHASVVQGGSNQAPLGYVANGTTAEQSKTVSPGDALFITTGAGGDWLETPNDKLWQGVYGINNPCPLGYRVPSLEEIKKEITAGTVSYDSPLKFVYAGFRRYDDIRGIIPIATIGYYWTSTVYAADKRYSYYYSIDASSPGNVITDKNNHSNGLSVRCIKD